MTQPWLTALTIPLGAVVTFVEFNLLRSLLRESREGERAESAKRFRSARASLTDRPTTSECSRRARLRHLIAAALVPATLAGIASAQDVAPAATKPEATAAAPATEPANAPSKSPFTLQLNLDYTTAYFYHGIIQEDAGLILQPAAKLTVNLYEHDDIKVHALLGIWNSFHGQKTGAQTHGDFTDYWYETDLIGGLVLTKDKLSLTTTYTFLTSPSDAYETVQELDLTLAFDDSEALGKFALHPYALLGIETGADGADGANGANGDDGTYLELGIAPGLPLAPIAISFPMSVGLSLSNYYEDATGEDDTFGFFQIGAKAAIPLPFGDRYGSWTLNAGVYALFLGDHTADYNNGDDAEVIGTLGLQVNF